MLGGGGVVKVDDQGNLNLLLGSAPFPLPFFPLFRL